MHILSNPAKPRPRHVHMFGDASHDRRAGVLRRLTGLRAFAALAVFILHLDLHEVAELPYGLSKLGGLGVAFFFVLSGFVLAWGTHPDLPIWTFYRRRFARVYPSDLATLIASALVPVVAVDRSWRAAGANALMLQAWFRDDNIVYGMNGVSWSLSCEAFFYACFPLAVLLARRLPLRWSWVLAILGLVFAHVAYELRGGLADHMPFIRLAEFFLGVVGGVAFREGWRPRIGGLEVALLMGFGLVASMIIGPPDRNAVIAVPFLVLVLHAANRDVERRPGWLQSRPFVMAGEASYAFYLVHELVIVNLLLLLPDDASIQVIVMISVATLCAIALHLAVERPCNRLLRGQGQSLALAPA